VNDFYRGKKTFQIITCMVLVLCVGSPDLYAGAKNDPSSYITVTKKTPQNILDDGNMLASRGEYKEADAMYNYALSVAKDSKLKRDIRSAQNKISSQLRSIQKAERKEKALKRKADKEKVASLIRNGRTLFNGGRLEEASAEFEKALKLDPRNTEATTYLERKMPAKREKIRAREERDRQIEQANREKEARMAERAREKEEALRKREADKAAKEAVAAQKKAEREKIAAEKKAQEAKIAAQRKAEREAKVLERAREKEEALRKRKADKAAKEAVAAQKKAEREKIAAQRKAERERIAAERAAERERIDAQRKAETEAKALERARQREIKKIKK
jgi:hypothetical protein